MNPSKPPPLKPAGDFRIHRWRFIALWLFPAVLIVTLLINDFFGPNLLCAATGIIAGLLGFTVIPLVLLPYTRREISFQQVIALGSPTFVIWVAAVVLRAIILAIAGKPL